MHEFHRRLFHYHFPVCRVMLVFSHFCSCLQWTSFFLFCDRWESSGWLWGARRVIKSCFYNICGWRFEHFLTCCWSIWDPYRTHLGPFLEPFWIFGDSRVVMTRGDSEVIADVMPFEKVSCLGCFTWRRASPPCLQENDCRICRLMWDGSDWTKMVTWSVRKFLSSDWRLFIENGMHSINRQIQSIDFNEWMVISQPIDRFSSNDRLNISTIH